MSINDWAAKWGVPLAAIQELSLIYSEQPVSTGAPNGSEAEAQQRIRLRASELGIRLWRNNCGACQDVTGRHIRYGLANESKKLNKKIKSSDLIGITPYIIQAHDVGKVAGLFTSIEVKKPGWEYKGTEREQAQWNWLALVGSLGGRAMFATGPEVLG